MIVESEKFGEYLEKLERSLQFQVASAAVPMALLITNMRFLNELDLWWAKVLISLGLLAGLPCLLTLGLWLALTKSFQAHVLDGQKTAEVKARFLRNQALASKTSPWVRRGISIEYLAFALALLVLVWSTN